MNVLDFIAAMFLISMLGGFFAVCLIFEWKKIKNPEAVPMKIKNWDELVKRLDIMFLDRGL